MSKITKALEKAARERLKRMQEQPTVTAKALEIPLAEPVRLDDITMASRLQIDPHIVSATDPK